MNEAELLFTGLLNCDRASLLAKRSSRVDKEISKQASRVLKRRISGEPLQYILNKADFMGFEFHVSENIFIPRPETEILVEAALKKIESARSGAKVTRILDIGTGSGCIAISLAKYLPQCRITAVDISKEAIEAAKQNALQNGVSDKISFIREDFFSLKMESFDYIVSNPPYVPFAEIEKLQPEVQMEPYEALNGGSDGLDFYRRLSQTTHLYLRTGGLLIMEMGHAQRAVIEEMLTASSFFKVLEIINDYNGIERVIISQRI